MSILQNILKLNKPLPKGNQQWQTSFSTILPSTTSICGPGIISLPVRSRLLHAYEDTLSCRLPGRGPLALRRFVGAARYNLAAKSGSDRSGCSCSPRLLPSHRRAGRARQSCRQRFQSCQPAIGRRRKTDTIQGRPATQ